MSEYRAARIQDGYYQMNVRHHKTFRYSRPAIIALSAQHFSWLKLCSQITAYHDHVFISWNGRAMKSGAISRQLHSIWVKAGIFKDTPNKNICCNIIHKSTSTGLRDSNTGHYQI